MKRGHWPVNQNQDHWLLLRQEPGGRQDIPLSIPDLIRCYREYMAFATNHIPTQKEFILNMEEKINDPAFLGDLTALLRPDELYDPRMAWDLVKTDIIWKL